MNCLITAIFSFTVLFVFFGGAFSLVSYMNNYRTNEDDELIPRKKFIIISALIIAVLLTATLSSACFLDNKDNYVDIYETPYVNEKGYVPAKTTSIRVDHLKSKAD